MIDIIPGHVRKAFTFQQFSVDFRHIRCCNATARISNLLQLFKIIYMWEPFSATPSYVRHCFCVLTHPPSHSSAYASATVSLTQSDTDRFPSPVRPTRTSVLDYL